MQRCLGAGVATQERPASAGPHLLRQPAACVRRGGRARRRPGAPGAALLGRRALGRPALAHAPGQTGCHTCLACMAAQASQCTPHARARRTDSLWRRTFPLLQIALASGAALCASDVGRRGPLAARRGSCMQLNVGPTVQPVHKCHARAAAHRGGKRGRRQAGRQAARQAQARQLRARAGQQRRLRRPEALGRGRRRRIGGARRLRVLRAARAQRACGKQHAARAPHTRRLRFQRTVAAGRHGAARGMRACHWVRARTSPGGRRGTKPRPQSTGACSGGRARLAGLPGAGLPAARGGRVTHAVACGDLPCAPRGCAAPSLALSSARRGALAACHPARHQPMKRGRDTSQTAY